MTRIDYEELLNEKDVAEQSENEYENSTAENNRNDYERNRRKQLRDAPDGSPEHEKYVKWKEQDRKSAKERRDKAKRELK